MRLKAITAILTASMLVGCASTTENPLEVQEPIYSVGDCIKFNPNGKFKTDGTEFTVDKIRLSMDRKTYIYVISQIHERIGTRTSHAMRMEGVHEHMIPCK